VSGQGAQVEIRPAEARDLAAVEKIEKFSFADPWPRAVLLSELTGGPLRYPLVAELAGWVVGYAMACRVVDRLHLLNLAVAREMRRAGVGSRLLAGMVEAARVWQLAGIILEVRFSNTDAQAFYLRHGFTTTGNRRGYYRDSGEDALIMTRALT